MRIAIVVAAADNDVIGCDGGLPWRMPSDLRRFRALTMGKPVVMGRKTFQSLPKALDGRDNIVITRDAGFLAPGAILAPSLAAALDIAREKADGRGVDEIMVIGGADIYRQALPLADRVYLTRIHAFPPGDATFPTLPADRWCLVAEEALPRGPTDDHAATLLIHDRLAADSPCGDRPI
jgi:dihydrofolate reductase